MKKQPVQFINNKGKRDIQRIGVLAVILILAIMNMTQFLSIRELRSPIVINFSVKTQLPWTDKMLISPMASKSAMVQKVYAAEIPSYKDTDKYKKGAKLWRKFVDAAYKLAPIYDYPVNVLLSQAALESNRGTSRFAVTRNNFFGYNCNDGREELDCTYFSTPDESIIEYMRLIKRSSLYGQAYEARTNPDSMIAYIKDAGYATDPKYVSKVMSMPEWRTK